MKRAVSVLAVVLGFVFVGFAQAAGDVAAGKQLFTQYCYFCHGEKGISNGPNWPNLAGQKEMYIQAQLRDFRAKVRPGTVMPSMAERMTDVQIDNLAAYLSSLNSCGL